MAEAETETSHAGSCITDSLSHTTYVETNDGSGCAVLKT